MKKLILLIFVITVIINNSNAQQERSIAFGLKVGTNYSDVYEQKGVEFNTEGKLGVVGGAFFAVCVGEYICIQPELLFRKKDLGRRVKYKVTLIKLIELPIT